MADQAPPAVRVAGLPPGVAPGPLGTRFVAYLIDSVIVILIGVLPVVLIWYTNLSPTVIAAVASVLMLAWALLVWWMFAVGGAGPGMRLMRLQLVGLANGRPIGWGRFLLRQLILFGLALTGIGLLLMVIFLVQNPRRQGWHDLAANAVVIKERQVTQSRQAAPPRHAAAPAAAGEQAQTPGAQPPPVPVDPSPLGPPAGYASRPGSPSGYPAQSGSSGGYPVQQGPSVGYPAQPGSPAGYSPQPPQPVGYPPTQSSVPPSQPPPAPPPTPAETPTPPPTSVGPATIPPQAGDRSSWRAVLDDGREIPIDGLVLLGRNPQARPGEEHATLIKVADTTRTVSKSHLEISLDSGGLYVVDRGSTNGSAVTSVSGVTKRCAPGEPIRVEPGSIVSFGDHWLEVRRN